MADESNSAFSDKPPTPGAPEQAPSREDTGKEGGASVQDEGSGAMTEGAMDSEGKDEAANTNGDVDQTSENNFEKPSALPQDNQDNEDTEMKDTQDDAQAAGGEASSATPAVNGTPAVSKRASVGGSSKKKSSAVPEHKSKKLNKKKSRPMTNLGAQPGDYYIARMKGHPPWPSVICDEDMLPQSLLSTRPVTAQLSDGTFKRPEYADGGKRAYERTFPIMFLHTNEFAWIPNTELTALDVDSDAVKNPVEKGKSKTLLAAYAKAAENKSLDHFKGMLADHQKALEADLQEKEEMEKERASKKAKKGSRKSDANNDDADEMDVDDDAPPEKPKTKKRKKAEDSEDVDEKPAKTPKTATKLKLSTPKTPATESSTKKRAPKSKAAKAAKSSSEDDAATPKAAEKPLTPAEAREIKEKKVLYYRHKLQRGFLSRDTTPKEDEMKSMSDFLAELEGYPDLEGSIIRATKIHKVLKGLIKLPSIPLDEEFRFKERSVDLLGKWNEILSNDTTTGLSGEKDDETKGEDTTHDTAPTVNGGSKNYEEQAKLAEAGEAAAPEEPGVELENKIGTTVEGEGEAEKSEGKAASTQKDKVEEGTDEPDIEKAPAEEYKPESAAEETS